MDTPSFVYDNIDVRMNIADAHRQTWVALAQAGAFWSDVDRIEIAKQARAARTQRNELAFNRTYPSSRLTAQALDATREIAADAEKIDRAWASQLVASLGARNHRLAQAAAHGCGRAPHRKHQLPTPQPQ